MARVQLQSLGALLLLGLYVEPLSTAKPSIQRVASLGTARSVHTATTLASGQVLIAGGMSSGGGSVATAELFDPARNAIEQVGRLVQARLGHSATLLPNGSVLIAGGFNGDYLKSVELFDPSTRRFRSSGSLTQERSGHTATLLPDGRVLFVGGVGTGWTFLNSAELYDPATGRSTAVGRMSVPRESHTATLLDDSRVLVVGGHSGRRQNMVVYGSAEVFDPESRRFSSAGDLKVARHKHDALKLRDGRVLIVAGADRTDRNHFNTTEIYDPRAGTFTAGPTMVHRRYKIAGTSVVLPNGDVLVTSGAQRAELLYRVEGTFREVPGNFPEAYRFSAVAQLAGGDVVILGGYSDTNENTSGVWRFSQVHLPSGPLLPR
jgi:hypothetical protein